MTETTQRTMTDQAPEDSTWRDRLPQFVWSVTSIVFLAFILFGSIEARIWTYGRLTFQRRSVAHVWRYFGDRLPDMPGGPIFPFLYYASLVVLVAGTIAGLGLFLLAGNEGRPLTAAHVRTTPPADE